MSVANSLDNEIVLCLPQLNTKQKKTILTVAKTFVTQQTDWWDEISEAQQKSIDRAIEQMKAGEVTPHGEVMKKYKK